VVRVVVSTLVLAADASFLVLLPLAVRSSRARAAVGRPGGPPAARHVPEADAEAHTRHTGLGTVGLAAVVLAVAAGVAADPAALGSAAAAASAGVTGSGRTTTVHVEARAMRFHPAVVEVPTGNRLVVEVVNRDTDVHDLALETGQHSGRLSPGQTGRLEVPVVGRALDGWCTIVGHRQMGMVFAVKVTGTAVVAGHHGGRASPGPTQSTPGLATAGGPAAPLDFMARPPAGFTARDAVLPAAQRRGTTHQLTLSAQEVVREVAVGVTQRLWTFNGTAPGPVVHGHVGDRFVVTLRNDAGMGHSIDFHAGSLAPDRPMRTVAPGQSETFSFTATRAGIWMYHCSSMPMSLHIANGMFGAVVIDPPGLPRVDREYVLVQSELYLGAQDSTVDPAKVSSERADAVVFNGFANQYDHDQLSARAGERVRVWVLDAGPNRPSSFHVVGGQFSTVFSEGAYLLRPGAAGTVGGAQSLALQPGQGGFVELTLPEPGHYPFVSHVMVDAERGAHGILRVSR